MHGRQIIGFLMAWMISWSVPAAGLFSGSSGFQTPAIPPPEAAFQWSRPAPDQVRVEIANQVYLYDQKTHFQINGQPVIVSRPNGQMVDDPLFGATAVHRGEVTFQVDPVSGPIMIDYQGCADAGFCYPPMQVELSFSR